MKPRIIGLLALGLTSPALAERDFCADRPGLGTPPCTLEPGRVQIELGLGDWTRDGQGPTRTDTITAGDLLLRIGLDHRTEAQIGWTAYGHVRARDRTTGMIERLSGVGDVSFALRRNLVNPDGSGFSMALQPYATLPAGNGAIGAGDWSAGLMAPINFDLSETLHLGLTPQIEAAVDGDRDGRHLNFGAVAGVSVDIGDDLGATFELAAYRDRAPDGHVTQALAGLSLGWQVADETQLDLGANAGLNRDTPDMELYFGISRRF